MKFKEFDEEIFKRDTNTTDLTNLEIVDEAITTLQESYFNKIDGFRRIEKVSLLAIHLLQQESKQLKDKINTYENPEDLTLMFMYCDEKAKDKIKDLNEKVDYLKNKCENKDKWCQLIADIGYDYDGYRQADSLMKLIDELVKYAIWSRDNYDYDAFQEEGNNE